jgi:hypothetical protein
MRTEKFNKLATLIGLPLGPATDAAKSVMVEGVTASKAARAHDVHRTAVVRVVSKVEREMLIAAKIVAVMLD